MRTMFDERNGTANGLSRVVFSSGTRALDDLKFPAHFLKDVERL